MSTAASPRKLLDSPEVAEWLGVPLRTLDQWSHRRVGPPFLKVGRHRRYRVEDVERWLANQVVPTGGDAA